MPLWFYMRRELYLNLSGNEVYYTNSLNLPVKNMLRSEVYYQKDFYLILLFPYTIRGGALFPLEVGVQCPS